MTSLFFNEQEFFNSHVSADEGNLFGRNVWPTDCMNYRLADASRATLDIACDSCIPHEGCLDLPVYGSESVWSADRLAFPAVASISNQDDTLFSSTSCLHQPHDSMAYLWEPTPRHPSVCEAPTLGRVKESVIPHSDHMTSPPESHPAREPTARPLSKRVDASRPLAQSVIPRSQYTPYALASDTTRRGDVLSPVCHCQWFDGARPCDAVVSGTKGAIRQHLQTAHAIRLKGDKTTQVCLWEACQKTMRGESIARHILAVHMQDKVLCPSCELCFARADSMQRHHKTCPAKRVAGRVASLAIGRVH